MDGMDKKYTFPVPGCGQCQYHQSVGSVFSETRYCAGFKKKKPRRFRRSDPVSKAPKWCPNRRSAAYMASRMSGQRIWISFGERNTGLVN